MSIFITLAHFIQTGSQIYGTLCWRITWIHFTHLYSEYTICNNPIIRNAVDTVPNHLECRIYCTQSSGMPKIFYPIIRNAVYTVSIHPVWSRYCSQSFGMPKILYPIIRYAKDTQSSIMPKIPNHPLCKRYLIIHYAKDTQSSVMQKIPNHPFCHISVYKYDSLITCCFISQERKVRRQLYGLFLDMGNIFEYYLCNRLRIVKKRAEGRIHLAL